MDVTNAERVPERAAVLESASNHALVECQHGISGSILEYREYPCSDPFCVVADDVNVWRPLEIRDNINSEIANNVSWCYVRFFSGVLIEL